MAAYFRPYMPRLILMYTKPLCTRSMRLYCLVMSAGMCRSGMRIYSGRVMKEQRKKSLRSQDRNRAPRCASEMTLLMRSLVSRREAAGEPGSSKYVNLSPPTTILVLNGSSFRGL